MGLTIDDQLSMENNPDTTELVSEPSAELDLEVVESDDFYGELILLGYAADQIIKSSNKIMFEFRYNGNPESGRANSNYVFNGNNT
jgi:hypothetical protein